jgi:hypothetical protein
LSNKIRDLKFLKTLNTIMHDFLFIIGHIMNIDANFMETLITLYGNIYETFLFTENCIVKDDNSHFRKRKIISIE